MKQKGVPPPRARTLYDRLAPVYPLVERFEAHVKARALEMLALDSARRVLAVGVGPGRELTALRARAGADARIVGIDLSAGMLCRARRRGGALLVQADAAHLPFHERAFDRLLAAYVLDILPPAQVDGALAEFHRVLDAGGRAVILAMTEGVSLASRAVIAAWNTVYALSPALCGGCRPLVLAPRAERAGFRVLHRGVIVSFAFPSELLVLEPVR